MMITLKEKTTKKQDLRSRKKRKKVENWMQIAAKIEDCLEMEKFMHACLVAYLLAHPKTNEKIYVA